MSIQETRLAVAVDATAWSRQGASPATVAEAFAATYGAVASLGGADPWSETLLKAAWELARAAAPRGGDVQLTLAALEAAHAALEGAPRPRRSLSRPRRDA